MRGNVGGTLGALGGTAQGPCMRHNVMYNFFFF